MWSKSTRVVTMSSPPSAAKPPLRYRISIVLPTPPIPTKCRAHGLSRLESSRSTASRCRSRRRKCSTKRASRRRRYSRLMIRRARAAAEAMSSPSTGARASPAYTQSSASDMCPAATAAGDGGRQPVADAQVLRRTDGEIGPAVEPGVPFDVRGRLVDAPPDVRREAAQCAPAPDPAEHLAALDVRHPEADSAASHQCPSPSLIGQHLTLAHARGDGIVDPG